MRPHSPDQGQPRPARPPTGWPPARHPGSSPRHHQFSQVRSLRQVLNVTAASQSSAGTSWSNRPESVSIGRPNSPERPGQPDTCRAGRQASRRQSPPGARGRERGNRRKGSAPRRRSLLSSLDPCPARLSSLDPCPASLAIQTSQTPGGRASAPLAARRASSMMLARVRGTAPYAWSTVSCMVSSFRFGGGMGSRPRRAHSRLGGAAVGTGSGEGAPKLHGLSGPRRITPLSTSQGGSLSSAYEGSGPDEVRPA